MLLLHRTSPISCLLCHAVPLPAGVQQRIFVHDFQSVLKDGGPHQKQSAPAAAAGNSSAAGPDIAGGASGGGGGGDGSSSLCAPRLDLATGSKISCVSFSPAVQQYLLSSDYTGVVQLWDLTGNVGGGVGWGVRSCGAWGRGKRTELRVVVLAVLGLCFVSTPGAHWCRLGPLFASFNASNILAVCSFCRQGGRSRGSQSLTSSVMPIILVVMCLRSCKSARAR